MNFYGKRMSLLVSVVMFCSIATTGSFSTAFEGSKITGCLTKRGKLKNLEFGEKPRKQCKKHQTLIMLPITGETDDPVCRSRFAGTYLTTIENSQGGFASRSIVTIHKDGNLSVVDSAELGAMFGHQQGSYRCTGTHSAKAITLDFSFAGADTSGSIARSDWVMMMTSEGSIAGEITVNFYRPLETCNPLEEATSCDVTPLGTFTFTSVQVVPSST